MNIPATNALCLVVLLLAVLVGRPVYAQTIPSIAIASPTSETTVLPGQQLLVIVQTTGGQAVTTEVVMGTGPLGATQLQQAMGQNVFNVQVPTNIRPGRYYLTAIGGQQNGSFVRSSSVSILVPMPSNISALSVRPSLVTLRYPGQQIALNIEATAGGAIATANPQLLKFFSDNPKVASIDVNGMVTAQSAGSTQVHVSHGDGANAVSTVVSVLVQGAVVGDLNGDGKVDIDDINILDSYLNTPASGSNDARDLNHDGMINALDARILTTLCTYQRCSTHP